MVARKRTSNPQRENVSDIKTDKVAKNRLASASHNYAHAGSKTGVKKPSQQQPNKHRKLNPLAPKVKKQRVYTEKELGIPKLNKSIDPEGVARGKGRTGGGKKGKKFVDDNSMLRILNEVTEGADSRNASKLEKARQLEAIREAKRVEMEKKEMEKEDKLNKKKREIKQGKRKAGGKKGGDASETVDSNPGKKKKVAFA